MQLSAVGTEAVWLPSDLPESELPGFIEHDNYLVQRKEDGIHILAGVKANGNVFALNRRGEPHGIPKALETMLARLPPETMLDAEKLHEGGMVAFDFLYYGGEDLRELPYATRLSRLVTLCLAINSPLLRVVETALTVKDKLALIERLRAEQAEGIIVKDLRSTYTPGRTAWGWSMRRVKFTKSLTAIVYRRLNDNKGSFDVLLIDPKLRNLPVLIGTVTAQQFFDQLEPGQSAVAEISYLYSTPSNKIVQPRLKRPNPWRSDKRPSDCTIDQLVMGGRFAQRIKDD